jgi:putative transcriptional regulator
MSQMENALPKTYSKNAYTGTSLPTRSPTKTSSNFPSNTGAKSTILEAVHDTAKGLHKAEVMDQVTLREFDRLCLPPIEPLEPGQIKKIREDSRVSQAVFAAILNTSLSTVQKWEIGQKRPTGAALKLLHLVQKRGWESVG